MMANAPLRTWIIHHLKKGDIPGLEQVKGPNFPACTFKFPWVRMGDPNWQGNWSVIFVSCFVLFDSKKHMLKTTRIK